MRRLALWSLIFTVLLLGCNDATQAPTDGTASMQAVQVNKVDYSWPYPADFSEIMADAYEDVAYCGYSEGAFHTEDGMELSFDTETGCFSGYHQFAIWSDFDPAYDDCDVFQNLALLSLMSNWVSDFTDEWDLCDSLYGEWDTDIITYRLEPFIFNYTPTSGGFDFYWNGDIPLPNPVYVCIPCDEMKAGEERPEYDGPDMKLVRQHFAAIVDGRSWESPLVDLLSNFGWEPKPNPNP